jgi:hypothetical protein
MITKLEKILETTTDLKLRKEIEQKIAMLKNDKSVKK